MFLWYSWLAHRNYRWVITSHCQDGALSSTHLKKLWYVYLYLTTCANITKLHWIAVIIRNKDVYMGVDQKKGSWGSDNRASIAYEPRLHTYKSWDSLVVSGFILYRKYCVNIINILYSDHSRQKRRRNRVLQSPHKHGSIGLISSDI